MGSDPLCVATNELFAAIYDAEAGNLALKCVAVGGVYVGGGIAPKMLEALKKGPFLDNFFAKGRFRGLMQSLNVDVALNPRAPLIGAANFAARIVAVPSWNVLASGLIGAAKDAIYRRLWTVLSGEDGQSRYRRLSLADRQAVVEILSQTKANIPAYFGRPAR